jgi:transcriptional/translational regulatory protein YebC/TACO1
VKSSLESQSYEILSSGIFYIPNHFCQIDNEKESTAAENLIKALEICPGVTGVHHNLA